jgi:hypothetical protein
VFPDFLELEIPISLAGFVGIHDRRLKKKTTDNSLFPFKSDGLGIAEKSPVREAEAAVAGKKSGRVYGSPDEDARPRRPDSSQRLV